MYVYSTVVSPYHRIREKNNLKIERRTVPENRTLRVSYVFDTFVSTDETLPLARSVENTAREEGQGGGKEVRFEAASRETERGRDVPRDATNEISTGRATRRCSRDTRQLAIYLLIREGNAGRRAGYANAGASGCARRSLPRSLARSLAAPFSPFPRRRDARKRNTPGETRGTREFAASVVVRSARRDFAFPSIVRRLP